jgi:putative membrane protein
MKNLLIRLIINAAALWAAIALVPGLEYAYERDLVPLFIIALIFGLMNALVRPLLILLTCPFIVLTLGLFVLIVNTILLSLTIWVSGEVFDLGLSSTGFWATFFGALVISIVSSLLSMLLKDDNEQNRRQRRQ